MLLLPEGNPVYRKSFSAVWVQLLLMWHSIVLWDEWNTSLSLTTGCEWMDRIRRILSSLHVNDKLRHLISNSLLRISAIHIYYILIFLSSLQFLWIAYFLLPLPYSLTFIYRPISMTTIIVCAVVMVILTILLTWRLTTINHSTKN